MNRQTKLLPAVAAALQAGLPFHKLRKQLPSYPRKGAISELLKGFRCRVPRKTAIELALAAVNACHIASMSRQAGCKSTVCNRGVYLGLTPTSSHHSPCDGKIRERLVAIRQKRGDDYGREIARTVRALLSVARVQVSDAPLSLAIDKIDLGQYSRRCKYTKVSHGISVPFRAIAAWLDRLRAHHQIPVLLSVPTLAAHQRYREGIEYEALKLDKAGRALVARPVTLLVYTREDGMRLCVVESELGCNRPSLRPLPSESLLC